MPADTAFMEKLTALCKRRGFIFPSSEIYGGIGGFWDYGPLGVELKRNIKDAWWRDMVLNPPDGPDGREITMVGVDCALIMNPRVWEASGHVGGFSDPMVDCRETKARYRADQLFTIQPKYQDPAGDFFLNEQWAFFETEIARAKVKVDKHAKKRGLKVIEYGDPVPFVGLSPGEQMNTVIGPETENPGTLTQPRAFNLMFETYVGALQDASSKSYLRPETAQGIFVNFPNVLDTTRVKIPFGIAQIGKAFRNEINPRNYTFRSREFEQMEIEFFCRGTEARSHEGTKGEPSDTDWYEFWRNVRHAWYVNLGLKSEKLRLRDQTEDELAHYSKACADIEYRFPFSDEFQELEGVAHRGCYDLQQHQTHSGRDLTYFDDEAWQRDAHQFKHDKDAARQAKQKPPYRFLPTVIEPSAGVDRTALALLCEAYTEDEAPDEKGVMQKRVVMKFHPRIAPIKAAFFPLVNRDGMPDRARKLYRKAREHMNVFYDEGGAIGRRYRRQDEVGTPFCITVDGQTLEDQTVTIRDRDTLQQVRVHSDKVLDWLKQHLA